MIRKILHIDLDAFFCAVEELRDPQLNGKPFAVGGRPEERGVVASCSYAARQAGVRSAMPMARAMRLCPKLIIIPSKHSEYSAMSQKVMAILGQLTPLVEQISIDEAFLDLSDLPESPELLARRLQLEIRQQLHLPCSIGAASNKLIAKIANDTGKMRNRGPQPPNAITVVPPGQEATFLAPLPVSALWGVGPKTAARLDELGIHTIGELASWSPSDLARHLGKMGLEFHEQAQGIDDRPVIVSHPIKSISQETTFSQDLTNEARLRHVLLQLSEGVGHRLRSHHLTAATIKLKLRWSDFTTLSRQTTLEIPTDQDEIIFSAIYHLFQSVWDKKQAIRLLGVAASNFDSKPHQLSLWEEKQPGDPPAASQRQRNLQTAVDRIRERYGRNSLQRGVPLDDEEN